MVKEYLEKTRDEFLDTKCNLSEKLVSAENHYKENLKIIQMLEESSDTGFEAFSPREVNSYNRSKISELKEEQKLVEPQIKVLRKQISDVDCKLDMRPESSRRGGRLSGAHNSPSPAGPDTSLPIPRP